MEKRGSAHVEMMIAFGIFIAFVAFLLIYIRPYENKTISDTVLMTLKENFENEVYTNLEKVFVKVNDSGCFEIDVSDFVATGNSRVVEGVSKTEVESGISGGVVSFVAGGAGEGYYIFVSEEFSPSSTCDGFETGYELGSSMLKKVVSNNSLVNLKDKYENDYDNLKASFGIPAGIDFAIVSGDYVLEKNIPESVDVIAKSFVYEVLDSGGGLVAREFVFKAW